MRSASVLAAFSALVIIMAPAGVAQRTSGSPHFGAPSHSAAPRSSFAPYMHGREARSGGRFQRSGPLTSLPFPFFGDSFNLSDIYSTGYPVASEPPAFLLQAAQALAGGNSPTRGNTATAFDDHQPTSQPLMIELKNGHYVRLNTPAADGEANELPGASSVSLTPSTSASRDLPPVQLVFRDGHTEQVRDYTIADGVLYARGDYYTDGYWNKKINLTTLNVDETLRTNKERNVKFVLPSSPNEVVTRP